MSADLSSSRRRRAPAHRRPRRAACLPQIQQAIAFVCRQRRLTRDDAHDLASDVYLRLLQHDGAVLRRYRGESSLHVPVVVIQRVLLDARIARAGKWRPSAVARRLGRVAIHLERLVFYEGLSLGEAGRWFASAPARHTPTTSCTSC